MPVLCLALGSKLMKLIFSKYVMQLHWRICLWPAVEIEAPTTHLPGLCDDNSDNGPESDSSSKNSSSGRGSSLAVQPASKDDGRQPNTATSALFDAILCFLSTTADVMAHQLQEAQRDLLAACHHSISHGTLLMLR